MNYKELDALSNAFIAVSTVLGVAGALGYYFSQVIKFSIEWLIFLEIIYFLIVFFTVYWIRRKIKNEKGD